MFNRPNPRSIDGSTPHVKFLWLFGNSKVCLPDSATATQLWQRFHQYAHCVCRCPDACRLFWTSIDAVLRPTFAQKLCYKLSRVVTVTFTFIQIFDQNLSYLGLLNSVKVAAFAWYSVKIRVIFGVRSERRTVDKKSKPTWKLKHANSILQPFEYFCQISSKLIVIISSYTVSKLGRFLRHSV